MRCAHERLVAGGAQLVAALGGAAVLPDDRAVQRLAARSVPRDDGLALVGDPDPGQRAPVDAGRVERLARDRARDVPDLGGVVLDPAGAREVLAELAVATPSGPSLGVEDDAGGAGRSLVDRKEHARSLTRLSCRHPAEPLSGGRTLPDVEAHITGTVWKVECQVGQQVAEGDTLVILESMKMEMPVEAEDDGTVKEIVCQEGQSVAEGDTLVVLD